MTRLAAKSILTTLLVLCVAPAMAQRQAMTKAQQEQVARDAASFARDEHAKTTANEPTFDEAGGERGTGQVTIDGRKMDVNKLTPSADKEKADSLNSLSESGSDMEQLRSNTQTKSDELGTDRGAEGQAYRTFERSASSAKEADERVKNDERFWNSTLPHIADGRSGRVQGEDPTQCETITTVETRPSSGYTEEEQMCDRVPDFSVEPLCTREYQDSTQTVEYDQDRRALLNIDNGESGEICRRERNVTSHQDTLSQSRAADLEITAETAGQSCRRYRWADTVVVSSTKTKEAALAINDEMGGMSCRRERWLVDNTHSGSGSKTATLQIDGQWQGTACVRTRYVSGGNASVKSFDARVQIDAFWGTGDAQFYLSEPPDSIINVLSITKLTQCGANQLPTNGALTFYSGGENMSWFYTIPGAQGPYFPGCITSGGTNAAQMVGIYRFTYSVTYASSRQWAVHDQGSCYIPPSPNCNTEWTCSWHAPATLNGLPVSAAEVSALPPLYPGAPPTCLSGGYGNTCGGMAGLSTAVSIADQIPAGVTTIQGFGFTVHNPQAGVSVVLETAPTAANGWVAQFRVNKTDFSGTTTPPTVTLSWQYSSGGMEWSVRDTGGTVVQNWGGKEFWAAATASITGIGQVGTMAMTTDCSDPGSTTCPTSWSCSTTAPTTINGIPVSDGMVNGLASLYPNAPSNCVAAQLRRTCSGASTLGTSIPIGDQIPAGVTQIHDLSFQILNPQPGVTATLVVPPTFANGWNAGFEVKRTDYSYQPLPVRVRITFRVDETNIVLSARETGNCSDPGSTACPSVWSCAASAPVTVNGVTVTEAMVRNEPPLYPGASNTCVEGLLSRVCNGSSSVSTQIPIGDLLPRDTTEITNFAWRVTNTQPQISVSLVSAPSLANGWVATFNVTRDYGAGGAPSKPNVMLTWNVLGPIEYDHEVITDGDCSGASDGAVSPSCPVRWRCVRPLPSVVNGIPLTPEMLIRDEGDELWPGEGWTCLEAVRERSCQGEGASLTEIDISKQLPPGTQMLLNYGWEILVPGTGITVTQVNPPTLANGWKALFKTSRNDWSVTPTQPDIRLFWTVQTSTTSPEVIETGDCSAEGDEMCTAKWRCVEEFPPGNVGGVISSSQYAGQYNTASAAATYSWSISSALPANVSTISNFQMQILQSGTAARISGITQVPSAQNGWMVSIRDNGACTGGSGGPGGPGGPPSQQASLLKIGNAVLDGLINRANAQVASACGPNILVFSWDNHSGGGAPPNVPPLYPGAPATCKKAERYLDCGNINGGEVCHETEQGTVCEVVEGGPFDNCGDLASNDQCQFNRTICNEDGWGGTPENPVCRIQTDVYKCRTPVDGEDIILHEDTVCHGNLSLCADGSCTQNVQQDTGSDSASMRKSAAHLTIRETMMTDYVRTGAAPRTGGGGGSDPGQPQQPQATSMLKEVGKTILGGVVADASAFDPFDVTKLKNGLSDAIPSDPDQFAAAHGNYTMDTLKFFDGKSYDCMKALGGLLNCCTKKIDPNKTNKEWWSSFGDILHEKWSENVQCKLDALRPDQKDSGAAFMTNGATFDDLSKGFTGLQDMLAGGGNQPSCGQQPRMEEVMNDFMGTMKREVFPRLGWYCDSDEKELAAKKETGTCTYLGDYCRKKVLGFCIDRRQRHCCFNSPMTKMIREQLRTLGIKGMGTAKRPDCSGVSVRDFARMNTADIDTGDLEGRMMLGGMFPDLANILNGSSDLLEMFTGVGSSINEGRVNSLDRTNDQLATTDPEAAEGSINAMMQNEVPDLPTAVTGVVPGKVSFVTGYKSIKHSPGLALREVLIGVTRDGNAGGVGVQVQAIAKTAVQGVDFDFAPQALTWGSNDSGVKYVKLTVRKSGRPQPVELELRLIAPSGGAEIGGTGVMQIQIDPMTE